MAKPPVSEHVQVNFRMPADLRDRIGRAAEAHNRSVTAEIVASLTKEYPPPLATPDVIIAALESILSGHRRNQRARWRSLVAKVAQETGLIQGSFGLTWDGTWTTLSYRSDDGSVLSISAELKLGDAMTEWLAQAENAATDAEQQKHLDELNEFLSADPFNGEMEAVIDAGGTSPRMSGKKVVLRLKP